MTVKLEPLADRLVVKPIEKDEVSKGGIILPDTAKEKPQEGKVIAVGPGRITEEGKRVAGRVIADVLACVGGLSGGVISGPLELLVRIGVVDRVVVVVGTLEGAPVLESLAAFGRRER